MLVLVIGLLCLELLLTSTAVAFISRGSPIRFAFLPVMVLATYRVIVVCSSGQLESPIARAVLGSGSVYRIIHYIAIVLLDGWTFEGPTSSLGGLVPITETCEIKVPWSWKSIEDRFRYGVRVSTTTRFSTTRWSIRYIPPFNSAKHGYVPSRSEFLWRSLIRVGILGCFLGLTGKFAQEFWKENAIMFAETRVPFFSRIAKVTLVELGTRVVGVLAYWTIQYLSLSLIYSFLSIVAVTVGLSDVEEWPPVFGSVDEAWSIAQFWGCFYHQNIRFCCSSIAHFVTYRCLRFRNGGVLGRYMFITWVFAISGLFHLLSDVARGIPKDESNAMQFFLIQPLGMFFEQVFQSLYSTSSPPRPESAKARGSPTRFGRVIGYGWVLFWISWTSPLWIYTSMRAE